MGKAFINLGLWIQKVWCKFQCSWNNLLKSISFKEIQECSYKVCSCSHKKEDVKWNQKDSEILWKK